MNVLLALAALYLLTQARTSTPVPKGKGGSPVVTDAPKAPPVKRRLLQQKSCSSLELARCPLLPLEGP